MEVPGTPHLRENINEYDVKVDKYPQKDDHVIVELPDGVLVLGQHPNAIVHEQMCKDAYDIGTSTQYVTEPPRDHTQAASAIETQKKLIFARKCETSVLLCALPLVGYSGRKCWISC